MKRGIVALALLLLLSGCASKNDPYRVDTVIRIPANPTEATAEVATETQTPEETELSADEETAAVTTEEPTETVPETETEPAKKTTSSTKKTTKKTTTTKKEETKKETEPAATETEPAATKPAETKPAATEAAATEAPATEAPATEPPSTEAPATEPAATEAPATEPTPTEAPVVEPEGYDISGYATGALERRILELVNEQRRAEGLTELYLDETLSAICSCRAWEAKQVWSHTRPDGRHYATVLTDYGYGANVTGELLIYMTGNGDGDYAVNKWMGSDSHRAQLMGENLAGLAVGIYRADGYTFICCMTES